VAERLTDIGTYQEKGGNRMKTGLLWYDNDPVRELVEKVERAAAHYERKFGRPPTLCLVHPSLVDGGEKGAESKVPAAAGDVEIRAGRAVLPNHFWLGVAEEGAGARRSG
jgi:hypothetical protein